MDAIKVTVDPLDVGAIYSSAVSPSCGAVALFVGTTRDHSEGEEVVRLEYDAYVSMAEKEMRRICDEIRVKWGNRIGKVVMQHRLGVVPVAEASVVVAVSAEHRHESIEATRFAIDTLKASVPIWKKEIFATKIGGDEKDEQHRWKENAECQWSQKH